MSTADGGGAGATGGEAIDNGGFVATVHGERWGGGAVFGILGAKRGGIDRAPVLPKGSGAGGMGGGKEGLRQMTQKRRPGYADLSPLSEDKRIEQVGIAAMVHKKRVGFVTDADAGKAERYIAKLEERWPGIVIISKAKGPVADTVLVVVGPPGSVVGT